MPVPFSGCLKFSVEFVMAAAANKKHLAWALIPEVFVGEVVEFKPHAWPIAPGALGAVWAACLFNHIGPQRLPPGACIHPGEFEPPLGAWGQFHGLFLRGKFLSPVTRASYPRSA